MAFLVNENGQAIPLNTKPVPSKEDDLRENYNNTRVVEHFSMPGMDSHPEWASYLVLVLIILAVLFALWKIGALEKAQELLGMKPKPKVGTSFGFRFY
jgi:hypothetical protein